MSSVPRHLLLVSSVSYFFSGFYQTSSLPALVHFTCSDILPFGLEQMPCVSEKQYQRATGSVSHQTILLVPSSRSSSEDEVRSTSPRFRMVPDPRAVALWARVAVIIEEEE